MCVEFYANCFYVAVGTNMLDKKVWLGVSVKYALFTHSSCKLPICLRSFSNIFQIVSVALFGFFFFLSFMASIVSCQLKPVLKSDTFENDNKPFSHHKLFSHRRFM